MEIKNTSSNFLVLTGPRNQNLAQKVVNLLQQTELNNAIKWSYYPEGEVYLSFPFDVKNKKIYLIHSFEANVNDSLMELLLLIDTCQRALAKEIIIIVPYLGYMRQDRRCLDHDPISAKVIAKILSSFKITKLITVDLHVAQEEAFFDFPVEQLYGLSLAQEELLNIINNEKIQLVVPDLGSAKRIKPFINNINYQENLVVINKMRDLRVGFGTPTITSVFNVHQVKNRHCLIIDDIISSGKTILNCVNLLLENGALTVDVFCSHALLTNESCSRIKESQVRFLYVLDTLTLDNNKQLILKDKLKILSIASKISKLIVEEQ